MVHSNSPISNNFNLTNKRTHNYQKQLLGTTVARLQETLHTSSFTLQGYVNLALSYMVFMVSFYPCAWSEVKPARLYCNHAQPSPKLQSSIADHRIYLDFVPVPKS
jgi:hypothetical protein